MGKGDKTLTSNVGNGVGKSTLFTMLLTGMKIHTSQGNLVYVKNVCLVSRNLSHRYKDVCKKLATAKMSKKRLDYIHCGVGITVKKSIKHDG